MVKLIILENYEKINNFIDQSFLHCLLCRCKIQQNSWKMLLGLSLSPDYGIHLYAEFYADSTFLYRSAGCYDIIGHWYISGDTVILSSPNFNVELVLLIFIFLQKKRLQIGVFLMSIINLRIWRVIEMHILLKEILYILY